MMESSTRGVVPHRSEWTSTESRRIRVNHPYAWLFLAVICTLMYSEATRDIVVKALSAAYWQVAAYIAGTLSLFYWIQSKLEGESSLSRRLLNHELGQLLFAAVMGVVPGCGGAIIVLTQFVKQRICFGAVVTVLTATMGDAAFLLLAAKPSAAFVVFATSFTVGLLMGLVVHLIHGPTFLRPMRPASDLRTSARRQTAPVENRVNAQGLFWKVMLFPTAAVALLVSFQVNVDSLFKVASGTFDILGTICLVVAFTLWAVADEKCPVHCREGAQTGIFQRVAQETNYVTSWVVIGFLAFELSQLFTGLNVTSVLDGTPALAIFLAVLVGCIPGCGPQVLVTTLFIHGALPMSAQLGNAINNDGDALFPALALAPRAAFVATVYGLIPGFLVAYGFMYFFE